jgi:hypothetical protein
MAPTQDALYRKLDVDPDLSWSERDLPERERTKHVHRLHPYLGKYVPQLVEALLARHLPRAKSVLDPFAGSGTTLVQSLEDGRNAVGIDVAAFNCLLMEVKTGEYNLFTLEHELRDSLRRLTTFEENLLPRPSGYLAKWFAPRAAAELAFFGSFVDEYEHADVLRIVLARAARSARRTTHFDLDFPREPQIGEYWCHKHKKVCRPIDRAEHFLRRYALDTLARVREFSRVRARGRQAHVLHGDARNLDLPGPFDGVVTSPPYPGLIDYHEQHRYAYELLGLDDKRDLELGAAERGVSAQAIRDYVDGIAAAFANVRGALRPRAPVVIVINDRRDLYPEILERAGLEIQARYRRHVNRRTGRRAGEFFEDVIVARS